jgi:hypothetical protein
MICEWFALCDHEAIARVPHPVLGSVPICQRCAERLDIELPVCLEHGDDCEGLVEYRTPLSSTGRSFPRCAAHWEARLDAQQRISEDYPDSPVAPPWFDPAAAGERWDDD